MMLFEPSVLKVDTANRFETARFTMLFEPSVLNKQPLINSIWKM